MNKKAWLASIVTLGIIDWYAAYIKHDGTLSQATRETFKTNTAIGKFFWVAGWGLLSAWILPHIWKWPTDKLSS